MAFLDDDVRAHATKALEPLEHDVELIVYTASDLVVPGRDAPGEQKATLELLHEVAGLSQHVEVVERKLAGDAEAATLGITLGPTTLLRRKGTDRSNLRFIGVPSGYEFSTLLETLVVLGTDTFEMTPTLEGVRDIDADLLLRTFVTPTCPYCPRAVLTAYRFALANPRIVAEGIMANETPTLSASYRISSVPDTIVEGRNGKSITTTRVLGAQPEHVFLDALKQATGGTAAQA